MQNSSKIKTVGGNLSSISLTRKYANLKYGLKEGFLKYLSSDKKNQTKYTYLHLNYAQNSVN